MAVRRCRPYLELSFVTFVTDHQPAADLVRMKSLATTSTARTSLRLQTWSNFIGKFHDRMKVVYAKGETLACSDALSRLKNQVSIRTRVLLEKVARMGAQALDSMDDFDVHEAFSAVILDEEIAATVELSDSFKSRVSEALVADA